MAKSSNKEGKKVKDVISAKQLHQARIDKILAGHANSAILPTGEILAAEFAFRNAQKRRK
jgi:hypothetical protein